MRKPFTFFAVLFFLVSNIILFAYRTDSMAHVRRHANIALDSEVGFVAEFNGKTELLEIKRTEEEIQKNKISVAEYKKRLQEIEEKMNSDLRDDIKDRLRSEQVILENKTELYTADIYYIYRAFATVVHRYKGDVEDKVIIELRVSPTKENLTYEKIFRTDLKEGEKCYFSVFGKLVKSVGESVYNNESYLYRSYSDQLESEVKENENVFFQMFSTISFLVENLEKLRESGHRELDRYNIFKGVDKKEIPAIWQKNMAKFKFEKNRFDLNEKRKKNHEAMYLEK